jgi:3-hydroxyisobutyrate dehydrogenase-like beta-hydroxyacid dehydrogenase
MNVMNVLWIGFGKMGEPMCRHVAAAGHNVRVLDPGEAPRLAAAAAGLALAGDASSAAISDVIVTSLPSDAVCAKVLAGPGGVLAHCRSGAVLIDTSTISVGASRVIADAAESRGVAYLRAPVSGTVNTAAAGSLSTFVSGPEEALRRARAVIECYTSKIIWVGPAEQARVVKLAVNLMVSTLLVSLSEAYAFCRKGGVDPEIAIKSISESALGSPWLSFKADALLRQDFTPTATVTLIRKDLKLISDEARDIGAPILVGAAVDQIMAAAESMGYGEEDLLACAKVIATMAGI